MPDTEVVRRLAHRHLPPDVAAEWLALLRPAVRLVRAEPDGSVVARLGGAPLLPRDVRWPEWPGHGPLSYIGELLCGPLAAHPLEVPLPSTGRLLFFYFDGSFDDFEGVVGTWDAETLAGARVLHVPDHEPVEVRPAPDGVEVWGEASFGGQEIVTAPGWEHPALRAAFGRPGEDRHDFMDHPVNGDAFTDALFDRHTGPLHQVGGYADPEQGPVELEVAHAALGNVVDWGDPRLEAEAARWLPLLQVDSDDDLGMMWGDVGKLYWLSRGSALAQGDVRDVSFTWQCG